MNENKTFEPEVLLRSEDSAGEVGIVEIVVPPDWGGPPLHRHDFDEAFYVLDGELTFQLDDEFWSATRGGFRLRSRRSCTRSPTSATSRRATCS